ncbi:MAG: siderophore-interacting protein [Propionibacteriales bacterium]|nr:siderophore-interacting protein [Propionibacteriales bacterium]
MTVSTTRRGRRTAAGPTQSVLAEVTQVRHLTPHMVRITVRSEDLFDFPYAGGDHWFRLFLPRPGQDRPRIPVTEDWYSEMLAMPGEQRPILRNYTVRRFRPALGEIDIDLVRHGDTGPATRWAGRARVGDLIGLLDQGVKYQPLEHCQWRLFLGDESALPAIGSIVEGMTDETVARVLVEVPTPDDIQDLAIPPGADVRVTWLPRSGTAAGPGDLLRAAAREVEHPDGRPYVWIAGESSMVTDLRRHFVERGIPKDDICFSGYWRKDGPTYDD